MRNLQKSLPLYLAAVGSKVVVQRIAHGKALDSQLAKLGIVRNNIADVVFKSSSSGVVLRLEGIKVAISTELSRNIFISTVHA